jgi:hypothetical protein
MSGTSVQRLLMSGVGPLNGELLPSSTVPATGSIILNATVGTTATKVLSASTSPAHKSRRVKVDCRTAARKLGIALRTNGGASPAHTAVGDGTATDGIIVEPGAPEWLTIPATTDLWLVASAAATAYQLTVVEG